jgi:hypothetical protein
VKLDAAIVERLTTNLSLRAWLRLTPTKFAGTPIGMGYGEIRFEIPTKSFKVLYLARNLVTCVAETIVRDRFVGKARRRLTREEIEAWGIVEIAANPPLSLLDLRATGPVQLGIPTNAVRGKAHRSGRLFSETLYARCPWVDGILYPSRLTNDVCIAVYDRAATKHVAGEVYPVIRQRGLVPALAELNIEVL